MLYTLLLYLFHSAPATPSIVPIIAEHSNQIRVFCFSDKSHQVTFHPNNKCQSSCGVYDSQNSCCKMWTITEDTVVQCDQYRNGVATGKSVEITATLLHPESNIQIVSQQNRSILTCVDESPTNIQLSHPEDSNFHVKYAYLYGGYPKKFNTFSAMKTVELPANEAPKSCNRTNYRFKHNNTEILDSLSELEEKLENNSDQLDYVHRDMLKWRHLVVCLCVAIIFCILFALLFMVRYCRKNGDKFTEEKLEKYPHWVSSISIYLANLVKADYNPIIDPEDGKTYDDKDGDDSDSCDVDVKIKDVTSIEQAPTDTCVEISNLLGNDADEGKRDGLTDDKETKEGDEEASGKDDDMEGSKDDEATAELGEASLPDTIEKLMRVNEQLVDKVTILLAKLEENELGQKSVSQPEEEPAEDGTQEECAESGDDVLDQDKGTLEADISNEHITEMAPSTKPSPIPTALPVDSLPVVVSVQPELGIPAVPDQPETSNPSPAGNPPVDEAAGSPESMPVTEIDMEDIIEGIANIEISDVPKEDPSVEEGPSAPSEIVKKAPSQSDAGPVHQNERLWKEGNLERWNNKTLGSSWNDVYGRAIGDHLYLYEKEKDFTADNRPKAKSLALDKCTVQAVSNSKKPCVFKFIPATRKVYHFNAESDSDVKDWIARIKDAKAHIESRD